MATALLREGALFFAAAAAAIRVQPRLHHRLTSFSRLAIRLSCDAATTITPPHAAAAAGRTAAAAGGTAARAAVPGGRAAGARSVCTVVGSSMRRSDSRWTFDRDVSRQVSVEYREQHVERQIKKTFFAPERSLHSALTLQRVASPQLRCDYSGLCVAAAASSSGVSAVRAGRAAVSAAFSRAAAPVPLLRRVGAATDASLHAAAAAAGTLETLSPAAAPAGNASLSAGEVVTPAAADLNVPFAGAAVAVAAAFADFTYPAAVSFAVVASAAFPAVALSSFHATASRVALPAVRNEKQSDDVNSAAYSKDLQNPLFPVCLDLLSHRFSEHSEQDAVTPSAPTHVAAAAATADVHTAAAGVQIAAPAADIHVAGAADPHVAAAADGRIAGAAADAHIVAVAADPHVGAAAAADVHVAAGAEPLETRTESDFSKVEATSGAFALRRRACRAGGAAAAVGICLRDETAMKQRRDWRIAAGKALPPAAVPEAATRPLCVAEIRDIAAEKLSSQRGEEGGGRGGGGGGGRREKENEWRCTPRQDRRKQQYSSLIGQVGVTRKQCGVFWDYYKRKCKKRRRTHKFI